ncbi:MAG: hypothetical protein IT236_00900 [Bacteroidia bacterium]|nr:hypothetical protein [Bacteroidia bacterium]
MNFEDINFPVYRRYKNNASYFKILNPLQFEEVQRIGSKKIIRQTEAKLYPEKLFIHDLVYNFKEMAEEIYEAEYEQMRQ